VAWAHGDPLGPKLCSLLISLLESKYISADTEYKPVDFALKAQFFTLDVISDIAMGKAFGNLDADKDTCSLVRTSDETLPIVILLAAFPWLANVFSAYTFKLLLPSDNDTVGLGKLIRFVAPFPFLQDQLDLTYVYFTSMAKDVAAQRFGPDKNVKNDMVGSFIRHGLTERELQGEIIFQMYSSHLSEQYTD
jgi:hypothetical protein